VPLGVYDCACALPAQNVGSVATMGTAAFQMTPIDDNKL
jgi:hypothetical protein